MARPRGSKQERQAQAQLRNGAKGKLFGYVRVSTKEQGECGHSLHGQRERLRQAAEAAGYELLDIVEDIESGARQRENLVQVQKRIDDGQAEGVIFGKLDRLGRSQIHLAQLVKWAKDTGVTLLSADEGLQRIADTFSAEGKVTARGAEFKAMTVYRMINRVDPEANPIGGH